MLVSLGQGSFKVDIDIVVDVDVEVDVDIDGCFVAVSKEPQSHCFVV